MLEAAVTAARLEGVTVAFKGGVRALDGVDCAIAAGGITALVGESGSGKTTLCRVLAGLQAATTGRVEVAGAPTGRAFHRTVQMLLQDAAGSLSPRMTVGALLREPGVIHGLTPDIPAMMQQLGLGAGLVGRYPHQLSGGQARRVAIARALLLSPRLLIADEPTAGLDLSVQGELLNLLLDLHRRLGLTMLIATHDLGVVRRIASDVVVLYLGQVVEQGPVAQVFEAPAHPYTAALLSAQPSLDPALRRRRIVLRGDPPSLIRPPTGCRFHTRCAHAQPVCLEAPQLRIVGAARSRCHFNPPADGWAAATH